MVTLQLRQLTVPPGQRLLIEDVDWAEFEQILAELGEHRASRIAYIQKTLEIRMPTPEPEIDKELIGDMVKILLDELGLDCECFGSTTFKAQSMESSLEPDQCFYIQNHARMRGKRRIDLTLDPPPDLAIEVDVTSKTQLEAYVALGVAELWRYENNQLQLYMLRGDRYQRISSSPTFPDFPLAEQIAAVLQQSISQGRSPALRAFRRQIRQLVG